jgi:predicted PurR-regulated permease PerM
LVLYFGQDFLIPFALAVLLSFALGPVATRLRRWGLGRIPSVILVVVTAAAAIGGLGILVGSQVVELADNLPAYQQNIASKIRSLQSASPGGGVFDRAADAARKIGDELTADAPAQGSPSDARPPPSAAPLTVRIEEPRLSPFAVIERVAGPLLGPVGTAGLVVVLVIFMLLEREHLRDRLITLVGRGDLNLTTEALGDAAKRVSRYLLMQAVVNATYGLPIGIGLYAIGVPNALLWGVLAALLRFVPFVGPFIAALFPVVLAVAVDPGWTMLALTVALFLTVELVSNNVVEPWLYGASAGISSLTIILAAFFWATLWGPVGLFLATPLTVCLAVMGRHVPQLRFLDVMLGVEPVMRPEERLYQRMLADDAEEGEEIAQEFLRGRSLADFYDGVAVPALRLAERDRHDRLLSGERRDRIAGTFIAVFQELADHEDPDPPDHLPPDHPPTDHPPTAGERGADAPVRIGRGFRAACIGGRTGLDFAAATMLAHLLRRGGLDVRALPGEAIGPEGIEGFDFGATPVICLAYLGGMGVAQARQTCLRLRRRAPNLRIVVALLHAEPNGKEEPGSVAGGIAADAVAFTLRAAAADVAGISAAAFTTPMAAPPTPADESGRIAELRRLTAPDDGPDAELDRITRRLAEAFEVPAALVSLVDERRQVWRASTGLPEDLAGAGGAARETSICGHVVARGEAVVVEDTLLDERFANNPFLLEHGIRFYAGAPLRTASGHSIGSLCVMDTKPRSVSRHERALLQLLAEAVVRHIEASAGRRAEAG